jgi:hypothetical protein
MQDNSSWGRQFYLRSLISQFLKVYFSDISSSALLKYRCGHLKRCISIKALTRLSKARNEGWSRWKTRIFGLYMHGVHAYHTDNISKVSVRRAAHYGPREN